MPLTRLQTITSTLALTLLLATTTACGSDEPVEDDTDVTQADAGPDADSDADADETPDTEGYGNGEPCPSTCNFSPGVLGGCEPCEEGWCIATNTDTYCTRRCQNDDECGNLEWTCDLGACRFQP